MDKITYKEIDYPIRTFRVVIDREEQSITIADELLKQAIEKDYPNFDDLNGEAADVDCGIYFYVEVGVLDLPAAMICEDCLDIEIKLIEEIL